LNEQLKVFLKEASFFVLIIVIMVTKNYALHLIKTIKVFL